MTAQLAYELLQPPLTGAARGGVHGPGPAHHPAQPRHGQHQVLLLPRLQVHDVREVGDAGRAVLGVARPVRILRSFDEALNICRIITNNYIITVRGVQDVVDKLRPGGDGHVSLVHNLPGHEALALDLPLGVVLDLYHGVLPLEVQHPGHGRVLLVGALKPGYPVPVRREKPLYWVTNWKKGR